MAASYGMTKYSLNSVTTSATAKLATLTHSARTHQTHACLLIDEIDEAAAFELIHKRGVDKTLRLRQRRFVFELVIDHELNSFHRRTRNPFQSRFIILPGSFE